MDTVITTNDTIGSENLAAIYQRYNLWKCVQIIGLQQVCIFQMLDNTCSNSVQSQMKDVT